MRRILAVLVAAMAMAATAVAQTPAVVPNFVWLSRPSPEELTQHYPAEALAQRVSGQVLLQCIVQGDGRLACEIRSETPEGAGFGEAALQLSQYCRVARAMDNGRPSRGGRIILPINFIAPQS